MQTQHQRHRGGDQQHGAQNVELVRAVVAGQALQRRIADEEGQCAQRQVDPEDQRPVQVLGEEAAERGAEQAGQQEDAGEIDLILAALLGRHDVGDDGLGQRDEPAAAQSLHGARGDEPGHGGRHGAGHGPRDENDHAERQRGAAALDVAELAIKWRHCRGGEEVDGGNPGDGAEIAEIAGNRRKCSRDDGLVEGAEEHGNTHTDEDDADIGMGHGRVAGRLAGHGLGCERRWTVFSSLAPGGKSRLPTRHAGQPFGPTPKRA